MVDTALLSFSFFQGVFAFFAPCAVTLLPGYLSAFVTRKVEDKSVFSLLRHAGLFALCTILGIISIYGVATVLILLFRQFIKDSIVYIGLGLGVIVVLLGIRMLMGKPLTLALHTPRLKSKSALIESYLFGITYGIGVLGCLFPFFLAVAVSALQAPSVFEGGLYLGAYIFGLSILMLGFYICAQFAQAFLQKTIRRVVPYLNPVGGGLVILAGLYIIWYQSALL